jgi:phosphoribosylaminoimidazolecarboxamide formyltransferase/IMP cyclohydrolase
MASTSRPDIVPIRRALFSVSDKRGLVELARFLAGRNVELLASGGTRNTLLTAGQPATEIADYTGQKEILGGRVKTLHPKVHGGILARRNLPADLDTLAVAGIGLIDLVVVNLYPFEDTIANPASTFEDAVENIDIGGPTLIRSAAKNHVDVAVVTSPSQYESLVKEIEVNGGTTSDFRRILALEAFKQTARYDAAIGAYLGRQFGAHRESTPFPPVLTSRFVHERGLRYGENPHQSAALYVEPAAKGPNLCTAKVLHGKELSYNNMLDLDSALRLIRLFDEPAACILKHNNPCGAAVADDLSDAFELAYQGDPVSAYGGIVGLNRGVDVATAQQMCQPGRFLEAILAPGFEPAALDLLTTKPTWKNSVRLIELGDRIGPADPPPSGLDLRRIEGGLLAQSWDQVEPDPGSGRVVTKRSPTESEGRDLGFAWRVCSMVKSNAIVVARGGQLLGVGAGQMSRLDSVRIAVEKSGDRARGAVLASDAFFPFRDGPDAAAGAGITAIIQPGGSKRDDETIASCNEHGIAMLFTGRRHFRH